MFRSRCLVDPMRPKDPSDISKPLSGSVIHTGHGNPYGESWGSPAQIDEVYLRNPMDPPDILGLPVSTPTSGPEIPANLSPLAAKSKRKFF